MINYSKIKERFPKAYSAMQDWLGIARTGPSYGRDMKLRPRTVRNLYDFFDDYGINVLIGKPISFRHYFDAEIYCSDGESIFLEPETPREVMETAAFVKAFEILEQKL